MQSKYLILRYSSLGDIVLCSAVVEKIQQEDPTAELHFLTKEAFAAFVKESFPAKNLEVTVARSGLFGALLDGVGCFKRLHSEESQLRVLDLHGNLKSKVLCWVISILALFKKAKVKVSRTSRHSLARSLSCLFRRDLLPKRHVFREHLATLEGVDTYSPRLKAFGKAPPSRQKILIAPDSAHWKKTWFAPRWEELCERLLAHPRQFEVTLVGSSKCLPTDIADDISDSHTGRVHNLLGKTELEELPRIAAEHDVCVCTNSAWLHISEAVETPVVSLAGPIVEGFGFFPWRPKSINLEVPLDCRPCSKHGSGPCNQRGDRFHKCMTDISVEDVYSSTLRVLGVSG